MHFRTGECFEDLARIGGYLGISGVSFPRPLLRCVYDELDGRGECECELCIITIIYKIVKQLFVKYNCFDFGVGRPHACKINQRPS